MKEIDYLKMPELKDGWLYRIHARNADLGIWFAGNESFVISRFKFGRNFIFEEYHWDCESFATARPIRELERAPFDPSVDFSMEGVRYPREKEGLGYLNEARHRFPLVKDLVREIEDSGFECEAGPLADCRQWRRLRRKLMLSSLWYEEAEK